MLSHSDLDDQIERLKRCEYIKESEVKALCDKAREILVDEGNVQLIPAPVTVCEAFLVFSFLVLLSPFFPPFPFFPFLFFFFISLLGFFSHFSLDLW